MNDQPAIPIVRQGDRFVVVDKPAGLLSVPGKGEANQDCVAARVRAMFPGATGPLTVHRLDQETSGLMVLALDAEAHRALSMQFEARTVEKKYEAVLVGDVRAMTGQTEGVVTLKQRVDLDDRPRQILDDAHGKEAITRWRVIEQVDGGARTRVEFAPETGRSHQLRVASATPVERGGLGCSIAGDSLYGDVRTALRMLLHATFLAFDDPSDGARVTCVSDAPF